MHRSYELLTIRHNNDSPQLKQFDNDSPQLNNDSPQLKQFDNTFATVEQRFPQLFCYDYMLIHVTASLPVHTVFSTDECVILYGLTHLSTRASCFCCFSGQIPLY